MSRKPRHSPARALHDERRHAGTLLDRLQEAYAELHESRCREIAALRRAEELARRLGERDEKEQE